MTAEQYKPIYHWFSDHPAVKRLVVFLDRWLPLVPFVCYPVLLCLLNVRLSRLFLTQKQAALDFMVLIARSVFVPGSLALPRWWQRRAVDTPCPPATR
mgnify:CR=1 FL=1